MQAKNTIRLFFALSMLNMLGISFIAATYVHFLMVNKLDLMDTNMVNFFFYATIFLFDVPTGALADVFGRKTSYVFSCLLMGVSHIIYSQSHSFGWFVVAEVIGAIAATFCNGAFEAWLVDRLAQQKHVYELTGLLARKEQLERAAMMIGAVFGAWIADKDITLPWILSAAMQLMAGMVAVILMKEERAEGKSRGLREGFLSMKQTVKTSVEYGMKQKDVRFFLMMGMLLSLATQAPNMQWQPFFGKFVGGKSAPLGWIFAVILATGILGSAMTSRWLSFWKERKKALIATQMGIGLGIVLTAYMKALPLALGFFLLHELVRAMFYPIKAAYIHNNIPSSERATIMSFDSMMSQVGGMIGLVGSGLLAKYAGIPATWAISGGFLFFAAMWLMRNGKT